MSLPSENELRKAWLKHRFASWEYHEEMLRLHAQWLDFVKKAIERPEVKRDFPQSYKTFKEVLIPLFEEVWKPGVYKKYNFEPGQTTGWARRISEYSVNVGDEYWGWMTPQELRDLGQIERPMNQMANNIVRTVDDTWFEEDINSDDSLLDERDTGPIDWPADWKEEILTELGLKEAIKPLRAVPGEPCPEGGYWSIWHSPRSRRRFKKGEIMPDYKAPQGVAIWSYDINQTDRSE